MDYCLGFVFDPKKENVLLLKKARPEWQAGLFNGVGGKIESDETPLDAMIREFEEETGYENLDWGYFIEMYGHDWRVYCYKSQLPLKVLIEICGNTKDAEEPCKLFSPQNLSGTISNLHWLIPMALDDISYNFERT